jgi:hypothetical protein
MAHVFDTGLDAPVRTVILDRTVALLAGLKRPAGYLAGVMPWGGVVRSWMDSNGVDMLFETLSGAAPAIAVAVGDLASQPAAVGGFTFKEEIELLLYHVSNNMRDVTRGRLIADAVGLAANTNDPGIHIAMAHAKELVIGQYASIAKHPAIKQIRPDREEELTTRDDVTIWLQTYRITLSTTIKEHRSVSQIIDSIRVRTTQEDGEAKLPAAATSPTTIDTNIEPLP